MGSLHICLSPKELKKPRCLLDPCGERRHLSQRDRKKPIYVVSAATRCTSWKLSFFSLSLSCRVSRLQYPCTPWTSPRDVPLWGINLPRRVKMETTWYSRPRAPHKGKYRHSISSAYIRKENPRRFVQRMERMEEFWVSTSPILVVLMSSTLPYRGELSVSEPSFLAWQAELSKLPLLGKGLDVEGSVQH